ncbi:MAG: hypothetical protein C7B45_09860 [Sulfobacillus acidophilus]|uniref:HTH gntR-type domain-containing protein n=1 Tax=Sulfobacillus acidophilus TaxID=53633 RepID=A0A2T2WHK0_9FIRM|nr:MAG: hypothetical protein C7B45_09860 [Sulfobacillus acidophilus]
MKSTPWSSPIIPPTVRRSQFTTYVLEQLRYQVLSGQRKHGERLVEQELAAEFNVSRGPVRDALFVLEQEGLVLSLSRGGTEVVGLSSSDIVDFYAVRYQLENMACETLLTRPVRDLQSLQSITNLMAEAADDSSQVSILDVQFHHQLVRLASNHFLLRLWETLGPVVAGMLKLTNSLWVTSDIIDGHTKIVQALDNGDTAVSQILKGHLDFAKTLMEQYVSQAEH